MDTEKLSVNARAFLIDALIGKGDAFIGRVDAIEDQIESETSVHLLQADLWHQFHVLGTEMVITKAGRRMFPPLKIRLSGLDNEVPYLIYLDIDPVDEKRYRYIYQSSKWVAGCSNKVTHVDRLYVHPEGPQLGKIWNSRECIAFDKLKLTNGTQDKRHGMVPLQSMRKYQPRIYVQPLTEEQCSTCTSSSGRWKNFCHSFLATSFTFHETQFITVTSYQNQDITRLKIASNPFAKAFRATIKREEYAGEGAERATLLGPTLVQPRSYIWNDTRGRDFPWNQSRPLHTNWFPPENYLTHCNISKV